MIKTIKDLKIYKEYWYVLDLHVFQRPLVLPIYFLSKSLAKKGIRKSVSRNQKKFYVPIQGKTLIEHEFYVIFKKGTWQKATKYDYPKTLITRQQKKTFRTINRRRLRRMGILSLSKNKRKITDKPEIIKEIVNRQEVAKNKNSEAKIFQIEGKPAHKFYYLVEKKLSGVAGKLFLLNVILINIKKWTYEKKWIHTRRHDILRPWLVSEFKKHIHEVGQSKEIKIEKFIRGLQKEGVRFL